MRALVAIAATVLLVPREASADPAQARVEAARLFERGGTHFNLAEYDEAIEAFKAGYRLSPEPAFLYNLGQAYRLKGSCRAAARMYASYLRLRPDDPDHARIAAQQEEMETCGRDQRLHDFVDGDAAAARQVRRRVGLGLIGGGVVAAAIGGYFAYDAYGAGQELDRLRAERSKDKQIEALEARAQRAEVRSVSMLAAGGFLVVAGGILRYLGREPEGPTGVALSIDVRPDSRTVSAAWRF